MTEEVRMARGAALATAAAAPVVLGLAWWAAGSKGVLGAAFGLALAIAFFSATLLAVGAAGRVQPELMLPAAVLTFTFKMVVIGLLLFLLRDTTAFDREAFALALVAGTVIYLAAEIRFAMRAKIPYVVTDEKKGGRDDRFARP
jgi:ATP synthase protein I